MSQRNAYIQFLVKNEILELGFRTELMYTFKY